MSPRCDRTWHGEMTEPEHVCDIIASSLSRQGRYRWSPVRQAPRPGIDGSTALGRGAQTSVGHEELTARGQPEGYRISVNGRQSAPPSLRQPWRSHSDLGAADLPREQKGWAVT